MDVRMLVATLPDEVITIRRGDQLTIIDTETAEIIGDLTIDPTRRTQTARPSTRRK